MLRTLFQTKDLKEILAASEDSAHSLRRALGPLQVTLLGVGAIIGAGIFSTIGSAAAGDAARPGAGPSLMLSFVITALVCAFTALCYAEFASRVPISGSAYTYSYATLGELVAWIIGWDLMIEYAIGNVAVAISWSGYSRSLLGNLGIDVPLWLATDYRTGAKIEGLYEAAPKLFGVPIVCNLLAFLIVMIITVVLVWGIRESARFNAGMVLLKIVVLLAFVAIGLSFVPAGAMSTNWTPFMPNGFTGTLTGAAIVFFAYIGFDAVSTVAEETKNPKRDLPIGIFSSLAICTLLYVVVAAVFLGMVPFSTLTSMTAAERAEPLTYALGLVAPQATWASIFVAFGSVVAMTAVLLVFQMGQPRIFFSMARDGLLPPVFAAVHPKFKTPHVTTIATGLVVGLIASFTTIDEMVDLTNIGTLFAFVLVCLGIPLLRLQDRRSPEQAASISGGFRVPLGPFFLPLLGAVSCVGLMVYLPPSSWWRFAGWLVLGLAAYSAYGFSHSKLGRRQGRPEQVPGILRAAAFCFLVGGIGMMFVLPHDLKATAMLAALFSPSETARAALGGWLTVGGLGLGVLCWWAFSRRTASSPGS